MMKMASTSSALKSHIRPHDEVNAALLNCRSAQENMPLLGEGKDKVSELNCVYENLASAAKTVSDEDASAESTLIESRNVDNTDCDILIGVDIGDKDFGDDEASAIKFVDEEEAINHRKLLSNEDIDSSMSKSKNEPTTEEQSKVEQPQQFIKNKTEGKKQSNPIHDTAGNENLVVRPHEQSSFDLVKENDSDDRKRAIIASSTNDGIECTENRAKRVKISQTFEMCKKDETYCVNAEITTKRNRLDSIDIDSHAFDFEDMGLDLGQSNAVEVLMKLPALENSAKSNTVRKSSISSVPRKESVCDETTATTNSNATARGRGYSLDFFSFGMNEKESIEPELTTSYDVNQHLYVPNPTAHPDQVGSISNDQAIIKAFDERRPRGDSIIFDPTSFSDGGIHEENALQRSQKPTSTSEMDELEIMNSPGFIEPPPEYDMGEGSNASGIADATTVSVSKIAQNQSSQVSLTGATTGTIKMGTLVQSNGAIKFTSFDSKNKIANKPLNSNVISIQPAPPSSGSNCTLQLELLNQGGRIGMYLPNDRKARIAKFHSKRHLRIWRKRIKYDCRKKLADSRPRIKGRFVKRSDMD